MVLSRWQKTIKLGKFWAKDCWSFWLCPAPSDILSEITKQADRESYNRRLEYSRIWIIHVNFLVIKDNFFFFQLNFLIRKLLCSTSQLGRVLKLVCFNNWLAFWKNLPVPAQKSYKSIYSNKLMTLSDHSPVSSDVKIFREVLLFKSTKRLINVSK